MVNRIYSTDQPKTVWDKVNEAACMNAVCKK
jgi:hypothetical protein